MNAKYNEEVNKRRRRQVVSPAETDSINQENTGERETPSKGEHPIEEEEAKDYDHRFILQADEGDSD